jgi:two-component system response regulator RegX3
VHVKRLRSKVELDPSTPKHLVTVRGLGYKFET